MSDSSAPPKSCPQCSAALPAEATEGLCPRCLMAQAMQPSLVADDVMSVTDPVSGPAGASPRGGGPDFPLPEELTALLPADTYRVEGLLGRGGMGAVYKGAQLRLQRLVAIKIMRRDQGRDHGFEQRFHREALAMAKLNHPNIVSVIDYGEAGPDYLYIVMELVDGADMMDVIRTGRMTQEMALALLPQICDALQFAHDHGIVHRDIKPSNIMLTRDGRIKIADFGLAKRYDVESSFQTQSGTGMGTPDYAAPEQFITDAPIDHRADIYALGVMIYQMITGQLPRGVWKPPTQHTACDPHWDDIVSHAMQSDPKDRYQAASEIKTDVSLIAPKCDADIPVRNPPSGGEAAKVENADKNVRVTPQSRAPLALGILTSVIILAASAFFALEKLKEEQAVGLPEAAPQRVAPPLTFAGHRYEFVPGEFAWGEAKAKAEEMGGHLATITSKEENEWLYATFGSKLDPNLRASSIWLGGTASASGGPWKWVTGEPFTFTNWNQGQPDYTTVSGQSAEGPHGLVFKNHKLLRWHDDPAFRNKSNGGFIVEWDDDGSAKPAPSAPGAVDLLALADVVKDTEGGLWRREGTDLTAAEGRAELRGRGIRLSLALPVRVKGSYQLEVEFTKHGRKETVSVILPLADGRSVVANFLESAGYAGLVSVRGFTTKDEDNPTRTPHQLVNEHRYRAAVQVLLNGDQADITATFEGKPLFRFQGPVADLDSRQFALADQARPGIKSMDPVTWHSVRITPLDGGTLTPAREGVTLPATRGVSPN